jgi:hypothetical protein
MQYKKSKKTRKNKRSQGLVFAAGTKMGDSKPAATGNAFSIENRNLQQPTMVRVVQKRRHSLLTNHYFVSIFLTKLALSGYRIKDHPMQRKANVRLNSVLKVLKITWPSMELQALATIPAVAMLALTIPVAATRYVF